MLEIGCGHGVAVSLVCGRLTSGRITAIDRSQKMIEMATRRNREHVARGRAVLKAAALEEADFGDERFDKVFAFNVAPFWLQPREALGIVARHLAPDGAVYLFWDARHAQPGRARELAEQLSERMRLAEFSVDHMLVEDLRPMLARLLRDDVEVCTAIASALPAVMVDPGQLEQVLLNLAINGADAMPDGGTLTIAAAETVVDPETAAQHGMAAGRYVALDVSDTGCGMDDETQRRIFEPFFTTKGKGRNSGLGLLGQVHIHR